MKEANSNKGRAAESNAIRNVSFQYNNKYQGQKTVFVHINREEIENYHGPQ